MKLSSQLSLINRLSTISRDVTRHSETCYQKGFGGFTKDSLRVLFRFLFFCLSTKQELSICPSASTVSCSVALY